MEIPEGYRERIRRVTSKGKVYTYTDLVEVRTFEHKGRLVTSKSGKQYYNYYKRKGRPYRLDTWFAISNKVIGRAKGHCEICGCKRRKLNVHHRDGNGLLSNAPNHSIDNLIAVCPSCHMALHGLKKYGQAEGILEMRSKGMTLQSIGDAHGISRQRVHQLLHSKSRY